MGRFDVATALLLGGAVLCLLIGLYPFGPYQLTLLAAKRRRLWPEVSADRSTFPPLALNGPELDVAICMSSYNEAASISRKLDNLLAVSEATDANVGVFVYVDGADDGTGAVVESYGDRITSVVNTERMGKTFGMNHLVSLSDAPIVVFTDSTVQLSLATVERLLDYLSDPSVGCVTTEIAAGNRGASATASVGTAYWRFTGWTKKLESDTGSTTGAFGSLFAVRREAYDHVPNGLIDDLYLPLDIMCKEYRVVHANDIVAVKPHTTDRGDEFRRKQRIAHQAIDVHRAIWPRLKSGSIWNLYKYVAHLVVHWYGGYFLLASLVLAVAGVATVLPWLLVAFLMVAWSGFLVLAHKFGIPPMAQIADILLAFAGNMVGTWRAFFQPAELTWSVAKSVRTTVDATSGDDRRSDLK